MLSLLVASLVIGAAGAIAAVVIRVRDGAVPAARVRADRHEVADAVDAALLSGGVLRAVDALVADLAERGLVVSADDGALTVAPGAEPFLDMPLDDPRWTAPFDLDEAMLLTEIRRHGADGLDGVRRGAVMWQARRRLARLMRAGLLVSPTRRVWEPMLVVGPTLLAMFGCTVVMLYRSSGSADELLTGLSILAWIPVSAIIAVVLVSRPGFHGASPVSGRGRALLAALDDEPGADRAWVVARESGHGTFWDVRRRASRGARVEPNALAARRFGMVASDTPHLSGVTVG